MNAAPDSNSNNTNTILYGPPVDVFSFAIVLWELATKQLPYDGWAAPQVIVAVAHRGERLPLPTPPRCFKRTTTASIATGGESEHITSSHEGIKEEEEEEDGQLIADNGVVEEGEGSCDCPEPFLSLIEACWAHDPDARPTFTDIVLRLENMD
jgi:hypothetical protein